MHPDIEALESLREKLPDTEVIPPRFVREVDRLLERFPESTALWCFRGVLVQLGPEDGEHDLEEARRSFDRALEIDPGCAEANEHLGWLTYVMDGDALGSLPHFRSAVAAGAGADAAAGLIRALVELGRLGEAQRAADAAAGLSSEELEEARADLLDALDETGAGGR